MNSCNQCGQDMKVLKYDHYFDEFGNIKPKGNSVCICLNQECPNYALYQMSIEELEKDKNEISS